MRWNVVPMVVSVVAGTFLIGSSPQPGTLPAAQPVEKKPAAATPEQPKPTEAKPAVKSPEILEGNMKRLDGTQEDLAKYKGKVVIIVNVASKCGYTGQYAALEALYKEHKDRGLVILAFPANDYNAQEPKSNTEIAEFCSKEYGVTFPVFEKISVKGKDRHELYTKLAGQPEPLGGDPKWNFTKFLLNKEGKVVGRYDAKGGKTDEGKPDRSKLEPDLLMKVNELLGSSEIQPEKKTEQTPQSGS